MSSETLAEMVPTPTLLAAREALLEGIVAAGKLGGGKKSKNVADVYEGPYVSQREINIQAAKNVAERHRVAWEKAKADKDAMIADAVATKTNLPNNFWLEEHRARALYGSTLAYLEAIS